MGNPYPAVAILRDRGITITEAAAKVGVSREHLSAAMHRRLPLSPAVRQRLAELLAEEEALLFAEASPEEELADAVRAFVARSRADQGLPPSVEDPDTLRVIAVVIGQTPAKVPA